MCIKSQAQSKERLSSLEMSLVVTKRETQGRKLFSFLQPSKNSDILSPGNAINTSLLEMASGEEDIVTRQAKTPTEQQAWVSLQPRLSVCPMTECAVTGPFTEITLAGEPLVYQCLPAMLSLLAAHQLKRHLSPSDSLLQISGENAEASWHFYAQYWLGWGWGATERKGT